MSINSNMRFGEVHKNCHFLTRLDRSNFVYNNYKYILELNDILDVGCYDAPLRDKNGIKSYIGVDIEGKPDKYVDLEKVGQIPFQNNSFDVVICSEVLEHLDNFHFIYSELFRIARKHVIVSIPNSWCNARQKIRRGYGDIFHYGLPLEKPKDRHKWFFNVSNAVDFFCNSKLNENFDLEEICIVEKNRFFPLRFLRKIRYSGRKYHNRYCHTVFALFRNKNFTDIS